MSAPTLPAYRPVERTELPHRTPRSLTAKTKSLDRYEELQLVRQAKEGSSEALEQLIRAHAGLIFRTAKRFRCRSYSLEDLVQEGVIGMTVAIRHFEPERGHRLCTYALFWVRQTISRAAEQNDRLIHLPASFRTELRRLAAAEQRIGANGSAKTLELADATGLSEERVTAMLSAAPDAGSLEELAGGERESSVLDLTEDPSAPNPEQSALHDELCAQIGRALSILTMRERTVLSERFGLSGNEPRTLDDLSRQLSLSRERVRQIEATALRKLRSSLGDWQ